MLTGAQYSTEHLDLLRQLNKENQESSFFLVFFPSILFIDVIFISHNNECAISQLTNTLPESVKRFCVYQNTL